MEGRCFELGRDPRTRSVYRSIDALTRLQDWQNDTPQLELK